MVLFFCVSIYLYQTGIGTAIEEVYAKVLGLSINDEETKIY